jgi:hypothetical protein
MAAETSSSDAHKPSWHLHLRLTLVLLMALYYVVSVGPAARLAARSGRADIWVLFMKVYRPVRLIRRTPLRSTFDWWIGLWVDDLKPFHLSGGSVRRTYTMLG